MNDRFTRGFVAGLLAGIPTMLLNYIADLLHWTTLRWTDFVAILIFGHRYRNLSESIFSTIALLFFVGALGVIFTLVIPVITSRNLWFKAWSFSEAIWFLAFTITYLFKIPELKIIPLKTALVNFLSASVWGLLLGSLLNWFANRLDE